MSALEMYPFYILSGFNAFQHRHYLIYNKYELETPKQSHEEAAVPGQMRSLAMLSTKAALPTLGSRD